MIFSHYQIQHLLDASAPEILPLSTDLGISIIAVRKAPTGWELPNGQVLPYEQIRRINADENSCFQWVDEKLLKVAIFSPYTERYYSLMPTPSAPTMLISGIPMHRIKETTPDKDTAQKIKSLGKPYGRVLDTATGLGYTAIRAAKTASQVITIEYDPAVLGICQANPWSEALFSSPNIQQLVGDSAILSDFFNDGYFDAIIHDPPTFTLAGQLYSQVLYRTFYRILKPAGRLFHYIGDPDSRYGSTIGRGIISRLQKAGFRVTPKGLAFGVLAKK